MDCASSVSVFQTRFNSSLTGFGNRFNCDSSFSLSRGQAFKLMVTVLFALEPQLFVAFAFSKTLLPAVPAKFKIMLFVP